MKRMLESVLKMAAWIAKNWVAVQSATSRHSSRSPWLLPSGPDQVKELSMREDQKDHHNATSTRRGYSHRSMRGMQGCKPQKKTVRFLFVHLRQLPGLMLASVVLAGSVNAKQSFDHSVWDQQLQQHVQYFEDGTHSCIDYKSVSKTQLSSYLAGLAAVSQQQFDSWTADERLAFLINAYNAYTVEFILSKYPKIASIKDLGSVFSSPWKKQNFALFGENISLDHIEHSLIRENFDEPRIHVAVVCASKGCPPLQDKAFTATNLEPMLDQAMQNFLRGSQNTFDGNTLTVSKIFDWYMDDFATQGKKGEQGLKLYLAQYPQSFFANAQQIQNAKLNFHEYDWSLNDCVAL